MQRTLRRITGTDRYTGFQQVPLRMATWIQGYTQGIHPHCAERVCTAPERILLRCVKSASTGRLPRRYPRYAQCHSTRCAHVHSVARKRGHKLPCMCISLPPTVACTRAEKHNLVAHEHPETPNQGPANGRNAAMLGPSNHSAGCDANGVA